MRKFMRYLGCLVLQILAGVVVVSAGLALIFWLYLSYWPWGPWPHDERDIDRFLTFQPPKTVEILDDERNSLVDLPGVEDWEKTTPERVTEYRKSVTIGDIPPVVRNAILAAEDHRFYSHNGVDGWAISRVILDTAVNSIWESARCACVRAVRPRGASTLTQQVVRLVLLKDEFDAEQRGRVSQWRKLPRKLEEIRKAFFLERELVKRYGDREQAKDKILEMFAEMSFMGHGQYGLASAAQFYFGKELSEIKLPGEAAMLAGIIRDPRLYSPRINPVAAEGRRNRVLAKMVYTEGETEIEKSRRAPIVLAELPKSKTIAPAVVQYALESLWGSGSRRHITWVNGTRAEATVKRSYQVAANEAVKYGLKLYSDRHPEHAQKIQTAFVAMSNTGDILAMVGGTDPNYMSFNRAELARRQPGSAFKPFVYLAAIEQGREISCTELQPRCKIEDKRRIYLNMGKGRAWHEIHNYDGRYYGQIYPWQCFAESRNACTMWMFLRLTQPGVPIWSPLLVLEAAQRLGLYKNLRDAYPTIALGSEVVTPLELVAAYATFANGGYKVTPRIIKQVYGPDDRVLDLKLGAPKEEQVVKTEAVQQMQKLFRHAVLWQSGTGRKLYMPEGKEEQPLPFEVGCKTGTTNDFRDAWFTCFTYGKQGITIGAWVGMDDNTSLGNPSKCRPLDQEGREYCGSGAKVALPIVKKFLETLYAQGYRPDPFPEEINQAVLAAHKNGVVRRK